MACVAALTDRGGRPGNEDACCVEVAETVLGEVSLIAVCDGVGGLDQGGVASSMTVRGVVGWFEGEFPQLLASMVREQGAFDPLAVRNAWAGLLARLNDSLSSLGRTSGRRMGTTLTGALVCEGTYVLGHVGDCRAYLVGPEGIRLLTHDQTSVATGRTAGGAGPGRGGAHALLQAVGATDELEPDLSVGELRAGEVLVICSDGAWRRTGDGGVLQAFRGVDVADEAGLERACRRLVLQGLLRGERDNLTVACLSPGIGGPAQDMPTLVCGGHADDVATEVGGGLP